MSLMPFICNSNVIGIPLISTCISLVCHMQLLICRPYSRVPNKRTGAFNRGEKTARINKRTVHNKRTGAYLRGLNCQN